MLVASLVALFTLHALVKIVFKNRVANDQMIFCKGDGRKIDSDCRISKIAKNLFQKMNKRRIKRDSIF